MYSNLDYRLQVTEILKEESPELGHNFYINCRPVDTLTGNEQLVAINETIVGMLRNQPLTDNQRRCAVDRLTSHRNYAEWEDAFIMEVMPLMTH